MFFPKKKESVLVIFVIGILFLSAELSLVFAENATTSVNISGPDVTVPEISNVSVDSVTINSAIIVWDTNEPANSYMDYDTATSSLDNTVGNVDLVFSHSVSLIGLSTSTIYYYQVRSTDGASNPITDNNSGNYYSFTTSAETISSSGSFHSSSQDLFEISDIEILINNGASYTSKRNIEVTFNNFSTSQWTRISERDDFFGDDFEMAITLGLAIGEELGEEEAYRRRVRRQMENHEDIDWWEYKDDDY